MLSDRLRNGLRATIVAGTLVCVVGCGKSAHVNQTFIVAIDRSGSTDKFRAQQLDQMDTVATAAIADNCALEVWSFDSTPINLWGPRVPESSHSLDTIKRKEFRPDGTLAVRHVTRPALLLEAIAHHVQLNHLAQPNVLILSDGDSEVPSDAAKFASEGRTLAQIPGIRIAVIGISAENRKVWEHVFTPLLGNRFQMAGHSEADALLTACLQ